MASLEQVKSYIASWLQLGRKISIEDSRATRTLSVEKVVESDRYTQEFEALWQQISTINSSKSYLEGTDETVELLLTPAWEIVHCSLCNMLVALPQAGIKASPCPCHELPSWPNNNIPIPTGLVDSQIGLQQICQRLSSSNANN